MRVIVLASLIALVGCDHPMFHQDRSGGIDDLAVADRALVTWAHP
jgi:hypothetical protein